MMLSSPPSKSPSSPVTSTNFHLSRLKYPSLQFTHNFRCRVIIVMSNYTQIIKQLLEEQYSSKEATSITISTLNIKFIPIKAQLLLQSYSQLKSLTLVKCDLRKLENFPILPHLAELDISCNSLQGTFNYLMPLKSLAYLNISQNIISDYRVLEPLRRFKRVEVYLKDNPFTQLGSWKFKMKLFNIIVLKEPRTIGNPTLIEAKFEEMPKAEVEEEEEFEMPKKERKHISFGSFREKMMVTLQNNIEAMENNLEHPQASSSQLAYPQLHLEIEEMNPIGVLQPFPFDNQIREGELDIQIVNQNNGDLQNQDGDEYVSQNYDENDSDNDEAEDDDEPDLPYF